MVDPKEASVCASVRGVDPLRGGLFRSTRVLSIPDPSLGSNVEVVVGS